MSGGFSPDFCFYGGTMEILHSSHIPLIIPNWAEQLATLTRNAWTGKDGHCYFPYLPLTTALEWRTVVARTWRTKRMHSWVLHSGGKILSHAALIDKGTHWELGRLVAHNAPRGGTHEVCEARMAFCREQGIDAQMECTQAHTIAQWHATQCGMRFAGLGFLDVIDGVNWDIIYFDTRTDLPPFEPTRGILSNPLGVTFPCSEADSLRLSQISKTLTTNRGGTLPPTRFHILPELLEPVQRIIELNTPTA